MPVNSVRRPLALALLLLFTLLVPTSLVSASPLTGPGDDAPIVTPGPALNLWGLLFDLLTRLVGLAAADEVESGSPAAPGDAPVLPGDDSGVTLDPQG